MPKNITPYLRYQYQRLSKLTLVGLSLIFCALVLFTFDWFYQQKELVKLNSELKSIRQDGKIKEIKTPIVNSSLNIYGTLKLPNKSELPNILEFIHTSAKNNNIYFDSVDYKFTDLPSINSQSYEITLPASGKYLDVRKFIEEVNQINNGVVLKNIELSRENSQINDLDAFLQFTIYLKN